MILFFATRLIVNFIYFIINFSMYPTKCSWLLRQNKALSFPTSLPVLEELCGGIHPGQIIEFCGPSGIGKSKICMHLIQDCLKDGKKVVLVSSRRLHKEELQKITYPKNVSIFYVSSVFDLLSTLHVVDGMQTSLVVIEGVQSLLQAVLGSANFRGQALLNDVKCCMGALAVKSVILYTNGIVSIGDGKHGPALGRGWEIVPSVRIMILNSCDGKRSMWRNREKTAELVIDNDGVNIFWE